MKNYTIWPLKRRSFLGNAYVFRQNEGVILSLIFT